MKNICGIEIKGNVAILVVLEGSKEEYNIVEFKPTKIELSDHTDQKSIKSFYHMITDFFGTYSIDEVAIKSGSTGKFSSGPAAFKMEAIIQMTNANINFIKSQTLTAFYKKLDLDFSKINLNKYQEYAFKLAYYHLENK